METAIDKKLVEILEATQNPQTKRVINGLINIAKAGEIPSEKMVGVVTEGLRKLKKKDKVVESFFTELDNKTALDNLGLKALISTTKQTALYENDLAVQEFVNTYDEHTKDHAEYMLVDTFMPMIKRYGWNKAIGASVKVIEQKLEKFAAYKMVAETINALQNDKNPELYEEIITKLDRAFAMPENQVRHYVNTQIKESGDLHPAISDLIRNLSLLEKHKTGGYSNLSKVTYVTDRHQGRVKAQERVAPALFEDKRDVVLINNTLYEIKGKKINEIRDVRKAGIPTGFIQLCEKFLNFTCEDKKLKISDGVHEFAVAPKIFESLNEKDNQLVVLHDSGDDRVKSLKSLNSIPEIEAEAKKLGLTTSISNKKDWIAVADSPKGDDLLIVSTQEYANTNENNPQIEIDGEVQEGELSDIYADLSTMGVNPDIINLIKDMVANMDDVALMDNIVTVCPVDKGVIIDIIKLNPEDCDVYVNICDISAGINELVSTEANPAVVSQVANDYGIDISPFVGEQDEEPDAEVEASKKEKEKELQDYQDQLDEVMDNIEKINMLDDDYQEDEEVVTLKTQLEEQKGKLMEKIRELEVEMNDGEPVPDDIDTVTERIYDEFKSMMEDTDYVDTLRNDDDPNASTIKSGGVHQISETVSVIPVLEFEKVPANNGDEEEDDEMDINGMNEQEEGGLPPEDGEGEITNGKGNNTEITGNESFILANAYLQVQDSSIEENDEEDMAIKFDGTKYVAMEDGYVNLGVEPMDHEEELPDTIKEDIGNVLNTVSPTDDEGEQLEEGEEEGRSVAVSREEEEEEISTPVAGE